MQINPGGQLDLAEVVGRDGLVSDLFTALQTQSLLLTAERRMGKTHVLKKLAQAAQPNQQVCWRDLEGLGTAQEFTDLVLATIQERVGLPKGLKSTRWLRRAGGTKLGPITLPQLGPTSWKDDLRLGIGHALGQKPDDLWVFLWDEMPLMLQNIAGPANHPNAAQRATEAMAVLDVLRALRQSHAQLRMVYTGSIGLHHVLADLRQRGHTNAAVNDMQVMEVPPLAEPDATDLALQLMQTNGLLANPADTEGATRCAQHLAQLVDGVPYLVHQVLSALRKHQRQASIQHLDDTVHACITSADDLWNLEHHESRTRTYYGPQAGQALTLLDAVASAEKGLQPRIAINAAKGSQASLTEEDALQLLRALEKDFYLKRDDTGRLHFKFKVVLRWWRWHRDIAVRPDQEMS